MKIDELSMNKKRLEITCGGGVRIKERKNNRQEAWLGSEKSFVIDDP